MIENIVDIAIKYFKQVLLIIWHYIYKVLAFIPDFFIIIIFLFLLFLSYLLAKWIWKNREEWKAREF